MPTLNDALGLHPTALTLRARRAEVLAANLANADTPGYHARDIDFRAVLGAEGGALKMAATQPGHIGQGGGVSNSYELQYREPTQASLDQNSVDVQAERARFLDNAMRYQASVTFLNGRLSGLVSALRGE